MYWYSCFQLLIAVDYDNHCETSGSNCGSLHLIEREYWKIRGNNKCPKYSFHSYSKEIYNVAGIRCQLDLHLNPKYGFGFFSFETRNILTSWGEGSAIDTWRTWRTRGVSAGRRGEVLARKERLPLSRPGFNGHCVRSWGRSRGLNVSFVNVSTETVITFPRTPFLRSHCGDKVAENICPF